ncbi:M23 family metallopeptidase [Plantactinospora endophytica]|nr:M23 family metallopeptidase [Plantactinospora endophytica]
MPETDPTQPETTGEGAGVPTASRRTGRTGVFRQGRRARYVVPGLVALLGLGVAGGVTAVALGGSDRPADQVSAAAQESARSAAAQRADRSAREVATPTPTATVSPTPTAAAPTAPPTATPSRSRTAKAASPTASRKPVAWVNPMPGAAVTSCFGMRWGAMHAGIDLAMPAETPIRAAGAGTVVNAGWDFVGYGISVVVDHGNGWLTHYAHQSRTVVSVGQRVKPGQVIGYEGATGDATGPHLHFEVHNGLWNQVDPAPWMRSRGVDLGC